MTDKVNPSINRPAEAFKTAGAIAYGGAATGDYPGFVTEAGSPSEIAIQDDGIDHLTMNAFDETSTTSSFDVDIAPGEAFVFGSWLAIDTATTVTLAASSAGQTVYVGWDKDSNDDVIIGLDAAFDTTTPNTDLKIPIWEFDTDGSGVTSSTDLRRIGYSQDIEGKEYFGAEDFSVFYNNSNDTLELKDEANNVTALTIDKNGDVGVPSGDLTDGTNVVYDQVNDWVPQERLENDEVTINANDGLVGGGAVALGAATDLDVEPADFAGTFLSDDGADNLTVDLGFGLGDDGTGSVEVAIGDGLRDSGAGLVEVNESYFFVFTSGFTLTDDTQARFGTGEDFGIYYDSASDELVIEDLINSTVKMTFDKNGDVFVPNGDLSVAGTTVFDQSAGHVPAGAIQQGDGSGLDADTVDGTDAENLGPSEEDIQQQIIASQFVLSGGL